MLHQETPSPLTPLGAKGLAEGNCMSVPACIANAIADALNVKDAAAGDAAAIHALIAGEEAPRPQVAPPRSRPMKPRPFDYVRPDTGRRGDRDPRRARR